MAHDWTDEDVELIRKLAGDGISAGDMVKEFVRKYPAEKWTRNMIIGKAQRVGISLKRPRRASAGGVYVPRQRRSRKSLIKQYGAIPEPHLDINAPPPVEPPLQIKDVTDRQCRWPHGDPMQQDDFRLCGHPVDGGSYCSYHMRKAGGGQPRSRKDFKAQGGKHTGHLR